jgi:hypothetical protein
MIDSVGFRGLLFALLLAVLIVGGAAFFVGVPIWQLLVDGPFSWHLEQPRTWQGGIEVLVLAALLALAALSKSPRWRLLATLAFAEFYLRRHYVDLPLLVDVLYLELLVGLGAAAARVAGLPPARTSMDYLRVAVAGIVVWSIGAWTLSAFGIGSLQALRIYTLVLAIPVLALRHTPLCVFLWRRVDALGAPQRAGVAALAAWLLCLMARTNIVSGYDAWWYGLRGENVLVAGGSVFAPLDLVAPVHYYPKLYELLLIPVSALGDTSVIVGISILVLLLFALTCMELLKRLQLSFGARLMLTALCITLPAVANSALSPKPDLFSGWLLLLACLTAVRFARDGSRADGAWTLLLCALACASKLTAPPYVIAILAAAIVVRYRLRPPAAAETRPEFRFATAMLVLGLAVTALVTWRTWSLAGVPLVGPQQVVQLFMKLGMTLKPPVGLLKGGPPQDWSDVPLLLGDLLFRPQQLGHIVISWTGNVWLYFFALAFAAYWLRTDRRAPVVGPVSPIWWTVLIVGLLLLLAFRTSIRGADGGYFLLPMSMAILIGGHAAITRLTPGWRQRLLLGVLPAFALFQASYSFTSAVWSPGTRAFDLDFGRKVRDAKHERRTVFEAEGMGQVAEYLRAAPGIARVVGYVRQEVGFRLQATFEHLAFYRWWYRAPLSDADTFLRYLQDHRIDYLILPKPAAESKENTIEPAVAAAARTISADPSVRLIDDRRYVLYDLSERHARARCAMASRASAAPAAAECAGFATTPMPSPPPQSDPADTRRD